jgi:hypothetical protein
LPRFWTPVCSKADTALLQMQSKIHEITVAI